MKPLVSSLQNKILAIVLLSLICSMIFSGVALDILINKQFSDKTHQDFAIYSQRTKKYLKNIENKLEISTINFTKNEKLLSKISFISNYSDPNNYQKIFLIMKK